MTIVMECGLMLKLKLKNQLEELYSELRNLFS